MNRVDHCRLLPDMVLHCEQCGQSYQVNTPVPVDIMVAIVDAFEKLHGHDDPETDPGPG